MFEKIDRIIHKISNSQNQNTFLGIALFATLILVYILNIYFPLMLDDWAYSMIHSMLPYTRIENLSDIFQSQYAHYFDWVGRTVVHCIAEFLLLIGTFWHDIINTLALVLLLYLFYRISNYGKQTNVLVYLFLCLLMWFLQPGFASVYFWITGSANYMWGLLIIITFLYPYYTYYREDKSQLGNPLVAFLFLLLGVVAGWTNENMSFGIIGFILFFFYLIRKEKRKIPLWAILGFVGVIVGAAIMLKAPGNYVRFATEAPNRGIDPAESILNIKTLLLRLPNMLFLYFKRLLFIVIPYLVIVHYFKKQDLDEKQKQKVLNAFYLFFIATNLAFFAMIGSFVFPARAFFGILGLLIIALGILYSNFEFKKALFQRINVGVLVIATVVFLGDYYFSKYKNIRLIDNTLSRREKVIEEGKKNGQTSFIFEDELKVSKRLFFTDCTDDPTYWVNRIYASYYGIESVKVYSKPEK